MAYADDIVLLLEENRMRSIISRTEYVKKKKLELSIEKTKTMRFRKKKSKKKTENREKKD